MNSNRRLVKVSSWSQWLALWNSDLPYFELKKALIFDALAGKQMFEDWQVRVQFLLELSDMENKDGTELELARYTRSLLVNRLFSSAKNLLEDNGTLEPNDRLTFHTYTSNQSFVAALIKWFRYDESYWQTRCLINVNDLIDVEIGKEKEDMKKQLRHEREVILRFLCAFTNFAFDIPGIEVQVEEKTVGGNLVYENRFNLLRSLFLVDPSKLLNRRWLWFDGESVSNLREFLESILGKPYDSARMVAECASNRRKPIYQLNWFEVFLILEARSRGRELP